MAGKNISSPENWRRSTGEGTSKSVSYPTIQFAEVMDNRDAARMGRLKVFIVGSQGVKSDPNNWRPVVWTSPFAGATNQQDLIKGGDNENTFEGTQRSYGLWMTPPDIGNIVVVAFVNGRENNGVCLGCVLQPGTNHMIPGIPKGKTFGENTPLVPLAETNKSSEEAFNSQNLYDRENTVKDGVRRPAHTPFYNALYQQGLENDNIRGLTDSGARRENPSKVFGVLTPGGHQFVMDDANQKYIRLRTVGGAQILLDDSHSSVYVVNSKGTGWIEITQAGKIEVWSEDSISVRSEKDINFRADRDVNIESGRNVNIKANQTDLDTQPESTRNLGSIKGNVHIEAPGHFKVKADSGIDTSTDGTTNIYSGINHNLTALGVSNINAAGGHYETASVIHMNGPTAGVATPVDSITLQMNENGELYTNVLKPRSADAIPSPRNTESGKESIVSRFPTREPYPEHESQDTENQ